MGRLKKWHCNTRLPEAKMCPRCRAKAAKLRRERLEKWRDKNREHVRSYNREYSAKKRAELRSE